MAKGEGKRGALSEVRWNPTDTHTHTAYLDTNIHTHTQHQDSLLAATMHPFKRPHNAKAHERGQAPMLWCSQRRAGAASGEGEASAATPHLHMVIGQLAGMAHVSWHQLSLAEAEMLTHEASTFGVAAAAP